MNNSSNEKPKVALALIVNKDGQVLAVSRKNDKFDFGFPGGKAEGNESPEDTLRREVYEETGLHVSSAKYLTEQTDENGYICRLFVCDYHTSVNYFEPHLSPAGKNETGTVKWMDWSEFLIMSKSHPTYNEDAYKEYLKFTIKNGQNIQPGNYYIHKRTGELYYIQHRTDDNWLMLRSSYSSRPITMPVSFIENRVKLAPRIMFEYSAYRTADMDINPQNYEIDERAMVFAIGTHNSVLQEYDDHMYSKHLWDVLDVFEKFSYLIPNKYHRIVRASLWNHDIIEDARITWNDLKKRFNEKVADGSYAMSNEKGKNRSQRANKKYYDGLLEFEIDEVQLGEFKKLCDRIANVTNGIRNGKMLDGYRKEQPDFRNKLRSGDIYQPMWDYLDNLLEGKIQPIEYHEQYN